MPRGQLQSRGAHPTFREPAWPPGSWRSARYCLRRRRCNRPQTAPGLVCGPQWIGSHFIADRASARGRELVAGTAPIKIAIGEASVAKIGQGLLRRSRSACRRSKCRRVVEQDDAYQRAVQFAVPRQFNNNADNANGYLLKSAVSAPNSNYQRQVQFALKLIW